MSFLLKRFEKPPSNALLRDTNGEAVECVHELWSVTQVRTATAAYNIFMNSVDRTDEKRSTTPTCRAEKRLNMSLFTWTLHLCANNAYALFQYLREERNDLSNVCFQELKRCVAEILTGRGATSSIVRIAPKTRH